MAENFVNVTEGSGKKLHTFNKTIGANDVHDEIVLLGENYLASYTVSTPTPSSTATANSHLLQVMAGASLKVRIRRIEVYQFAVATTASLMQLQLRRLTTAGTGGGALTPNPLDPSDSASGATAMALPTVKGTEGVVLAEGVVYLMQTVAASAQLSEPIQVWDFDRPRSKPLVIAAGTTNGICIKNTGGIAGSSVSVNVWLDESNF